LLKIHHFNAAWQDSDHIHEGNGFLAQHMKMTNIFESAMQAGARVFLTGEISESQVHLARECGVAFVACGHHATERGGAQALGDHLAEHFSLEHEFVDIDNPA
jgi:putative NIF3 family GTP cyclohydrolase 1 type 2